VSNCDRCVLQFRPKFYLLFTPGVLNLGHMYPQGFIYLAEEVYLRLAEDEKKYSHVIYFQIFIHISRSIISKNHYMLIVKYVCE